MQTKGEASQQDDRAYIWLRLNPDKMEVLRVGAPVVGGLGDSLSFGGVCNLGC